ncbi:Cytochrome c [Zancudomyces culisetae]|uniref:Cytochrome c n=1 Tax=Zancudomyces culisetae TaxID=1213189 RepID=A0A1R1PX75_ZANCU|nr:Cytochrome c [Zancudomyces culisetae]|eukprot:OMH85522.1 Cytochrome c [Zancudomyces culisetae]
MCTVRTIGDAEKGAKLFKTRCAQCHSVTPGANSTGPSLAGVFNNKSGSVEGYAYTAANKNSGLTWDEETLEKYLTKPTAVVPGTKMVFAGFKKAKDRAVIECVKLYLNSRFVITKLVDMIAYLKTV